MKWFNKWCSHDWKVHLRSNALQADSMGYPLRLFVLQCSKCGKYKHMWFDVPLEQIEEIKTGESFLLTWSNPDKR